MGDGYGGDVWRAAVAVVMGDDVCLVTVGRSWRGGGGGVRLHTSSGASFYTSSGASLHSLH